MLCNINNIILGSRSSPWFIIISDVDSNLVIIVNAFWISSFWRDNYDKLTKVPIVFCISSLVIIFDDNFSSISLYCNIYSGSTFTTVLSSSFLILNELSIILLWSNLSLGIILFNSLNGSLFSFWLEIFKPCFISSILIASFGILDYGSKFSF